MKLEFLTIMAFQKRFIFFYPKNTFKNENFLKKNVQFGPLFTKLWTFEEKRKNFLNNSTKKKWKVIFMALSSLSSLLLFRFQLNGHIFHFLNQIVFLHYFFHWTLKEYLRGFIALLKSLLFVPARLLFQPAHY